MSTSPATDEGLTAALAAVGEVGEGLVGLLDLAAPDGDEADRLLQTLVGLTDAITRLQAAQMIVAERAHAVDATAATGWASTKDLLTHLTGGHKGTGSGILRLAEQTRSLPEVRTTMLSGAVSLAQVRAITRRVVTLPASPELRSTAAQVMVEQVRSHRLDATDLDRAFPDVVRAIDPDGTLLTEERLRPAHERGAHRDRHLALTPDGIGGVRIRGYAGLEDAELIRTTLLPLTAPVPTEAGACGGEAYRGDPTAPRRRCPDVGCSHDGRDRREHGVRLLDALVETCRRVQRLTTGPDALPQDHGTTARVVVTIDHDALRDQTGRATGRLGSGETLSAAACRRLACDAEVLPAVLGAQGQILDLGRSQRLVSHTQWLALVLRDQHCVFPGCRRLPLACEAHHITHWADGGPTDLDNLALLCRHHHTLTHHSPWQISIDPTTRRPVWKPPQPGPGTYAHIPRVRPPLPSRPEDLPATG